MHNLLDTFKGVKGREGAWTALCPGHPDGTSSLSIGTGQDGRWLLKCHAGCDTETILQACGLTMADLMPDRNGAQSRVETVYDYHDPAGALVYQVVRMVPKDFRQRRPDGAGGWIWNLKDTARYLYRLPLLYGQATVWIVEGEKDADRLVAEGLCATTKAGGASDWRDEFTAQLVAAGVKTAYVIPDNDGPGQKFAARVVRACEKAGLTAREIHLPGLTEHGDASDFLAKHPVSALLALVTSATIPAPKADDRPVLHQVEAGLTETSHAQRFAIAYGDELRYDHKRGIWLCYQKGRWRPDANGLVRRLAIAFVRSRQAQAIEDDADSGKDKALSFLLSAEKKAGIDRLVTASESLLPFADAGVSWDLDPWVMGTPDGILDLKTGQSRDGDPADRVTFSTSVPFDASAECPKWEAFLSAVFESDLELVGFLQRFIGYSLTGITSEQVLVLCYGKGANGKSTLLNTLRKVLGDYAHNLPFSSLEHHRGGSTGIPNDMAALANRRFVVASETSEGSRLNEGRIKALTGGDPISARFMHGEFFTFEPQAKFLLSVNHRPEVSDDTVCLWRRILLVPFLQTFTGSAADPKLAEKLHAEAPGILAWCVRGCQAWQRDGLQPPASIYAATEEYRADADTIGEFLDASIAVEPDATTKASALQDCYVKWADKERVSKRDRLTAKKLAEKLAERFTKRRTKEGIHYDGLRIMTDKLW